MRGWGGPKHRRAIVLALTAAGLTAVGLPGLPRAQALVPASVEARLTAGDSDDNFGPATDLDGDTAVAALNGRENGVVVQRSVVVFRRAGTAWAQEAVLALPLAQTAVTDLAVDGDTVAAGTSPGPTFVFTRSGTTWTRQATLTASDAGASRFGESVAVDGNTIVVFTTDNGTENFTWPDGGETPFAGGKGTGLEGGFRCPAILSWPGHVPADSIQNGIFSGMDWFPTFVAAAGDPNIAKELLKGKQLGDKSYKVHLDGYNQLDAITGKGESARHEIFYFTESTLAAVRINDFKYRFTDQPGGWLGATVKVDWPILINLRLDPFERLGMFNGKDNGSIAYYNWFAYEFWRFVFAQQEVGKYAQTFLEYPPMQAGASFNMSALKAELEKKMEASKAAAGN